MISTPSHKPGTVPYSGVGAPGASLSPAPASYGVRLVGVVSQMLDLWSGVVTSRYTVEGEAVTVTTVAHPRLDAVAVRIESVLVSDGRLGVRLAFPRGHDLSRKNTPALDWSRPESHVTRVRRVGTNQVRLHREIGATSYEVGLAWVGAGDW